MARARGGDGEALRRLVLTVSPHVRRWALACTADPHEAADIAQEALILMVRHIGSFRGRGSFPSWLFRIVRTRALDAARSRDRERLRRKRLAREQGPATSPPPSAIHMDGRRLEELVRGFLRELPPRQREVFELADLEGLSSPEIGRILAIEPATVRATLLRARRALRRRILSEHPEFMEEYRG